MILSPVIRSFADRETQIIWNGSVSLRLPREIQQRAREQLTTLHAATDLRDLRMPPSNRLEALRGNRSGQWSIRINRQWRVCFRWVADGEDAGAWEVEIADYH